MMTGGGIDLIHSPSCIIAAERSDGRTYISHHELYGIVDIGGVAQTGRLRGRPAGRGRRRPCCP